MSSEDSRTTHPLISIVTPFFNESTGVLLFFEEVLETTRRIEGVRFEFICIDDGSEDNTLSHLITLASADSRIRVIELSRNFGKESALTAGIDAARGDAIIPMDGDLQDPPELIATLIEKWREGAEIVLARRIDRHSDSWLKRNTATWFYRAHNAFSEVRIPPNVGDFRLMDRVAIDALKRMPERQRFMKGLFSWVGFRTEIVDYVRGSRKVGNSKFSGWKLWNFAIDGFTSFSTAPLKIWIYAGATGAFLSFLYGSYILVRTLVMGIDWPGYASMMVVVLFMGSLQLLSIGVLGEYIGRIYIESKQRPNYLVRALHEKPERKSE